MSQIADLASELDRLSVNSLGLDRPLDDYVEMLRVKYRNTPASPTGSPLEEYLKIATHSYNRDYLAALGKDRDFFTYMDLLAPFLPDLVRQGIYQYVGDHDTVLLSWLNGNVNMYDPRFTSLRHTFVSVLVENLHEADRVVQNWTRLLDEMLKFVHEYHTDEEITKLQADLVRYQNVFGDRNLIDAIRQDLAKYPRLVNGWVR